MILGFGDESEGKVFSLTACILEYEPWQALTEEWGRVLKESPRINHFHMSEARNYEGQFRGFTQLERDLKIIRLVSVIMNHRPRVITRWVVTKEYREIIGDHYVYEWRTPYFFCFLHLLWHTAYESLRSNVKLPVDFTFDEKGDVSEHAAKWFGYAKQAASSELLPFFGTTPVFRDDEKLMPLQVADLIAWHIHRRLEQPGSDPERIATERLDGLLSIEAQIKQADLIDEVAGFYDIFYHPASFLMLEKPCKRRKIWGNMQRKFKKLKDRALKDNPEFNNFDKLATEVLHATRQQVIDSKAKRTAPKKVSGRASSDKD